MREIELTQGKVALVDDEDYDYLSQFNWYARKDGQTFYALRKDKQRTVLMHRVILRPDVGMESDHIDGNG